MIVVTLHQPKNDRIDGGWPGTLVAYIGYTGRIEMRIAENSVPLNMGEGRVHRDAVAVRRVRDEPSHGVES